MMRLDQPIIQRSLRAPIRSALQWPVAHIPNASGARGNTYELRIRALLEQRVGRLEERQGADYVYVVVPGDFLDGSDRGWAVVVGDTCVGDDDVDLADGVLGLEGLDCGVGALGEGCIDGDGD